MGCYYEGRQVILPDWSSVPEVECQASSNEDSNPGPPTLLSRQVSRGSIWTKSKELESLQMLLWHTADRLAGEIVNYRYFTDADFLNQSSETFSSSVQKEDKGTFVSGKYIALDNIKILSNTSDIPETVGMIPKGTVVEVNKQQGDLVQIDAPINGWCKSTYVIEG